MEENKSVFVNPFRKYCYDEYVWRRNTPLFCLVLVGISARSLKLIKQTSLAPSIIMKEISLLLKQNVYFSSYRLSGNVVAQLKQFALIADFNCELSKLP